MIFFQTTSKSERWKHFCNVAMSPGNRGRGVWTPGHPHPAEGLVSQQPRQLGQAQIPDTDMSPGPCTVGSWSTRYPAGFLDQAPREQSTGFAHS